MKSQRQYLSLDTLEERVSKLEDRYSSSDHGLTMNKIHKTTAHLQRQRIELLIKIQRVETDLNDHKVVTTRFKSRWSRLADKKRATQVAIEKRTKSAKRLLKQANTPATAQTAQTLIMVNMMVDNGLLTQATANVALETGWSLERIMKSAKAT